MHAAFWCEDMQGVQERLLSQAENSTIWSGVFAQGTVLLSSAWRLEKQTSLKQGDNALLNHADPKCIMSQFPYFTKDYIETPSEVRDSLQELQKVYLENLFSLSIYSGKFLCSFVSWDLENKMIDIQVIDFESSHVFHNL